LRSGSCTREKKKMKTRRKATFRRKREGGGKGVPQFIISRKKEKRRERSCAKVSSLSKLRERCIVKSGWKGGRGPPPVCGHPEKRGGETNLQKFFHISH